MTARNIQKTPGAGPDGRFPDFPPREDMNNPIYLYEPGYLYSLKRHLGSPETTLVMAETPLGWRHHQREGILIPDLMIAFDVDVADVIDRRGYSIERQGKAPEFALEVASPSTGHQDDGRKRAGYAEYGVQEYWRFDPSGGEYHRQSLAGDRLIEGSYRPIPIEQLAPGILHGRSEALGLDVCWDRGRLRWWDPRSEDYLETHEQTANARIAEREARAAAENARIAEREARAAAEERAAAAHARVRELEAELERRLDP